jgi:hypothetical protein
MAAAVSSRETGAVKPAPRMFSTLFGLLDRADRSQGLTVPRIESLAELPAALGI